VRKTRMISNKIMFFDDWWLDVNISFAYFC
jgi:hypothetical protein